MTEQDILSVVKQQVREELGREVNETTEKLVHSFRCELGKHKNAVIEAILKRVNVLVKKDEHTQNTIIQINIIEESGEQNDTGKSK